MAAVNRTIVTDGRDMTPDEIEFGMYVESLPPGAHLSEEDWEFIYSRNLTIKVEPHPNQEKFTGVPPNAARAAMGLSKADDMVNHPPHYTAYNGIEVIDLTEQMNFNRGNAVKYIARAGLKGDADTEIQDLEKAVWYINREIGRIGGKATTHDTVSEQTIYTVYEALVKSGLTDEQVEDAVNMMQNNGILFRERL